MLIQRWKPWKKSTGPRSQEGKAKVAKNAYKGGYRSKLRALARAMRDQRNTLNDLKETVAENLGGQTCRPIKSYRRRGQSEFNQLIIRIVTIFCGTKPNLREIIEVHYEDLQQV